MGTTAQGTLIAKLQVKASDLDHHLARWHSRLYRAVTVIQKLDAAKKRVAKRLEELETLRKKQKQKGNTVARNFANVSGEFSDLVDTV